MVSVKNKIFFLSGFLLVSTGLWAQAKTAPPTTVSFEKIQLLDKYVTEGASVGDIDADGHPDIIAGPLWWKGPDFIKMLCLCPYKILSDHRLWTGGLCH